MPKGGMSVGKAKSLGRYGDTILAHISPEEAKILKRLGGAGTRNPKTGLPEFYGSDSDGSETASNAEPEGTSTSPGPGGGGNAEGVGPDAPAPAPGPEANAGLSDVESQGPQAPAPSSTTKAAADAAQAQKAAQDVTQTQVSSNLKDANNPNNPNIDDVGPRNDLTVNPKAPEQYDARNWLDKAFDSLDTAIKSVSTPLGMAEAGVKSMLGPLKAPAEVMYGIVSEVGPMVTKGFEAMFGNKGEAPAEAHDTGKAGQSNADGGVGDRTEEEGDKTIEFNGRKYKVNWKQNPNTKEWEPEYIPILAEGGQIPFAPMPFIGGGQVNGPGDGVEDKIPAMLSDGEFVIPARHVSALGNGSNKAGASRLYGLLKNIERTAKIDKDAKINGIGSLLPKG